VLAWPWADELLLAVGLVVGCLAVAAAAAVAQVRASDPSRLRAGEWE